MNITWMNYFQLFVSKMLTMCFKFKLKMSKVVINMKRFFLQFETREKHGMKKKSFPKDYLIVSGIEFYRCTCWRNIYLEAYIFLYSFTIGNFKECCINFYWMYLKIRFFSSILSPSIELKVTLKNLLVILSYSGILQ